MKFKVGDRVRVTNAVTDHRAKSVGKIYTVEAVNRRGLEYYPRKNVNYYSFDDRETAYIFYEDELELVPFAKADLKDGMVVGTRDGSHRFVFNDVLMTYHTNIALSVFDDNMIHPYCEDYNIDKVYTTSACVLDSLYHPNCLTLIWERPKEEPAKKMTVEEIEKELGYKVEIVSDSENK